MAQSGGWKTVFWICEALVKRKNNPEIFFAEVIFFYNAMQLIAFAIAIQCYMRECVPIHVFILSEYGVESWQKLLWAEHAINSNKLRLSQPAIYWMNSMIPVFSF